MKEFQELCIAKIILNPGVTTPELVNNFRECKIPEKETQQCVDSLVKDKIINLSDNLGLHINYDNYLLTKKK